MRKTVLPLLVVGILTGCAKPPKLDISMSLNKQNADLIFVKVKVVNTENHATVPIAIEVTGQSEANGHWDKVSTLLHPAAFVLNKKEQREITKLWRVPADAARTTLTVKEQETGNLLKTQRAEQVFGAGAPAAPAPATAKP
jgi:alpha-L-arabinofuranosidase